MVGLYGLLSYQVAQRTRDIGVRMALGARRVDVLRMIVAQGFMLTVVGLTIGVGGSLGLGRFLRTLLFGVTPTSLPYQTCAEINRDCAAQPSTSSPGPSF